MSRYLKYIIISLVSLSVHAQNDFRFRNFTINDGLSQSSVTSIVQDELNSLWIGTQDGLNRYDGKRFEVFTPDKTEGLESAYIRASVVDGKGNLWFGTNNGLTKYDIFTEEFHTYFFEQGTSFQIEDLALGRNNFLWIASTENGVFRFNIAEKKFQHFDRHISSSKTTKIKFIDDVLVVATSDQGLFIYDIRKGKVQNLRSVPSVNKMIRDGSSDVVLATRGGLYNLHIPTTHITKKFTKFEQKRGEMSVTDAYHHPDMGWLVATKSQGIYLIMKNGEHHYTEDIFQKTALVSNELNVLFRDRSGIFWVGSQRGISNFDPQNKGFLGMGPSGNDDRGIPSPSVWSFAESIDGRYIYVGTNKAVSQYDNETGTFKQFYRGSKNHQTNHDEMTALSIEVISDERLLVGCADGLFELEISENQYEYRKVKLTDSDKAIQHAKTYSIQQWKGTNYLIGTRSGALLYNIETKQLKSFEHDPKQPQSTISKGICRLVFKDRDGNVFLCTSTGGLNVVDEVDGEIIIRPFRHNNKIKQLSSDYITSIYQSGDDFWMGTFGSGLIRWNQKTKTAEIFNKSNGLPNDVIYGVISDEKENLWLSTNKGLCVFNPKNKAVKVYTEINGLMSNEFNLGAFMKASSGLMYFGGIYGYNYFRPSEVRQSSREVSVVFSRFKLENEWLKPNMEGSPLTAPVFMTREINLSYLSRSFTLAFQPSTFGNPDLINYKYTLEGSKQGEILLGTTNEIPFNALASGSYTLKVYARSGDGPWCEFPAQMRINISPPFWETIWFWSIIAISAFFAGRWVFKKRIEAHRREQVRLEMKIRDRTKEIQKQNEKIERQKKKIEQEKNNVIQQQKLLQIEKDKSERLLKNVIPESTAEELMKRGKARARAYKMVSVLFTDFVGFTKISDRMNPTELVKKLDVYFTKFDNIIVKNNLEKIKTIGDAYMCAGGVPVRNRTNPIDTCLAALQIQAYMQKRKNDAIANGREYWELRLGINTGEVTAGVIGSERLAYDIWGATVNQAQRMEMLGEPGKVTITGATFDLIEPYFECTFKGKAQSKSRGLIDMYVVERIKPELSKKGEGLYPNQRFNQIINLHLYSSINYYKAERHIMKLLERHLSKQLHYHSIAHTKDVVGAVERLALMENVTDEGLFLLKSAATYHDAGFIEQYDANEPIGARLAEEILPKYGYTDKHIQSIKELIYVTAIPHKPKNHLEEIICDADLDYLGRDDFHEIADKLRRELKEHGKISSDRQWDEIQVAFLKSHKYFTRTAIRTRKKKKQENLEEVIERLERNEYAD